MNTSENKLDKDNYCNRKSFLRHIYEFNFKNIAKQCLIVVAKTFLRNENGANCLLNVTFGRLFHKGCQNVGDVLL